MKEEREGGSEGVGGFMDESRWREERYRVGGCKTGG